MEIIMIDFSFRFLSLIFVLFWQENEKTFLALARPG